MTKDERVELAAIREQLLEAAKSITEILEKYAPRAKAVIGDWKPYGASFGGK